MNLYEVKMVETGHQVHNKAGQPFVITAVNLEDETITVRQLEMSGGRVRADQAPKKGEHPADYACVFAEDIDDVIDPALVDLDPEGSDPEADDKEG
jgi:hypothetical protein